MSDNAIRDHLQTIADEATGPHPVLDAVALCDEIERALTTGRLEREKLRAEVARLIEFGEMRKLERERAMMQVTSQRDKAEAEVARLTARLAMADQVLADWCGTDELDACDAVLGARAALAGEEVPR